MKKIIFIRGRHAAYTQAHIHIHALSDAFVIFNLRLISFVNIVGTFFYLQKRSFIGYETTTFGQNYLFIWFRREFRYHKQLEFEKTSEKKGIIHTLVYLIILNSSEHLETFFIYILYINILCAYIKSKKESQYSQSMAKDLRINKKSKIGAYLKNHFLNKFYVVRFCSNHLQQILLLGHSQHTLYMNS